jgi:hypothetical protein
VGEVWAVLGLAVVGGILVPRGRVWLQRFLVAGAVAALGLSLYWLATDSYDEFEGPSWLAFAFNVAIVAGVWIVGVYAGFAGRDALVSRLRTRRP